MGRPLSSDSGLQTAVENWFQQALVAVTEQRSVRLPLDAVIAVGERAEVTAEAAEAFRHLLDSARAVLADFAPLLVFPLPPTEKLEMNSPPLAGLTYGGLGAEPPAIFLLDRTTRLEWEDVEEYRVPIEQGLIDVPEVRAYYRAFRDRQSREQGWESSRAIYFEHFLSRHEP
jgi:hypothetical protein